MTRFFVTYFLCILFAISATGCKSTPPVASPSQVKTALAAGPAPVIAITSPPAGSFITTANDAAFAIAGTCNQEGQLVTVTTPGAFAATALCNAGAWSAMLDVSFVFDGPVTFSADLSDTSGNAAPTATLTLIKDTIPPFGNKITINDGVTTATSTAATLTLASTGASQMYVTNDAGCVTGGVYQPFAMTLAWTLFPVGNVAQVYVIFRDDAGNTSACLQASIPVNIMPPPPTVSVAITSPAAGTLINMDLASAFVLQGTCSEEGQPVIISGAASATTPCAQHQWSTILDLTSVADGPVTLLANHSSSQGFRAPQASRTFLKNTAAPTSNSISINGGAVKTTSTMVTLTLSSTGATQMYITNTAGCTSGGTLMPFSTSIPWTLAQTTGTATVYASFQNSAGNTSNCVSAHITVGPPVVPPLVITPSQLSLSSVQAQSVSFVASGGTPAYSFSIVSGSGTIQAVSGVFTAGAGATGTTIVRVADHGGLTADATITWTHPTSDLFIGTDGTVLAIAVDGDGNRYLGGEFSRVILQGKAGSGNTPCVRGIAANNLVKIKSDGTVDLDFLKRLSGTNRAVRAIAISRQSIYIGGDFTRVGKNKANHIAKIAPTGELDLSFSPQCGPNGTDLPVYALAANEDGVFAGGGFFTYRSKAARSLVKVSPEGVLNPNFTSGCGDTNGTIRALALTASGASLYVGGDFTKLRGVQISDLARVDALSGQTDIHFNSNGLANDVFAIAIDPNGRGIYVSSRSSQCGQGNQHELVRLGLTGGLDASFAVAAVNGTVLSIAVDATGNRVYVGGSFSTMSGKTVNGIALLNSQGVLSTLFSPSTGPVGVGRKGDLGLACSEVHAIAIESRDVLIGGWFSIYRGMAAYNFAELELDGAFIL